MYLYHYDPEITGYDLKEINRKNDFIKEYRLTYDSPYRTGIKINDKVHSQLFLNINDTKKNINDLSSSSNNNNRSNDVLILVHGFLTSEIKLKKYYSFIDKMNSANISCAFINLPFHLNRTPEGEKSGNRLINFDDVETLYFFHQSVVDIKKLIDILKEKWNFNNIYICGISLGSMVSVVTMANDNRISKGVLLIGGGNWEEIHWKGVLKFALKGNCIYEDKKYKNKTRREACGEIYSGFPKFLEKFKKVENEKIKIDPEGLSDLKEVTGKMCFLCDPLTFAHKINPRNVLMINSRYDFFFSKTSTNQLWEELGRPEIHWLNKLHTSKILTNEKIAMKIKIFLSDS